MLQGLYIHIPFCVKKCSYCDFYSLPARQGSMEAYVQAVLQEAEFYGKVAKGNAYGRFPLLEKGTKGDFQSINPSQSPFFKGRSPELSFQTLYLGGGTPSLLGVKNFKDLMNGIRKAFDLTGLAEATIEVNPEPATREFLEAVKDAGFTRVSFGVQSLSDDELKSVGRIHTAEQAIEAIKLAKKLDFKAISADLIIGLPGQTWTSLHKPLNTLVGLGVQHLSVYCLSLEEGTILKNNPPADLPSDDMQAKLFEETKNLLNVCGYAHYEISNFAVRGYECQHNLNYWRGGEYLGLGAAAASHLDGKRFKNRANLDAYIEDPNGQIEYVEELSKQNKAAEEAMLRLRLLEEGLDTDELANKFGGGNVVEIVGRLNEMAREGLLFSEGTRYRLNPDRILTSNPIFARVLAGVGERKSG